MLRAYAASPSVLVSIANRLRPPGRGRVLGADSAARGQRGRAARAGHIEYHANVAAAAEGPLAHQRTGGGILEAGAEREHERTRAVIDTHAVVSISELQSEQDLRQLVPARRRKGLRCIQNPQ